MRQVGLDADAVFDHPDIKVWRKLPDRENCTLDADLPDGRHVRLHVKRYRPERGTRTPAEEESLAIRALETHKIPTVPLVGWGKIPDGRSFLITEDLTGFRDSEKLVHDGLPFERLLEPTADLAARLHAAGLHHRDLYLCHFFARPGKPTDLRLIDAARVKFLPGWPMRQRWIVKDLAQFWFSTMALKVSDEQRARWLARYAEQRNVKSIDPLRRSIERKVSWIARHDANLRETQKDRNVSIPH